MLERQQGELLWANWRPPSLMRDTLTAQHVDGLSDGVVQPDLLTSLENSKIQIFM